MPTKQSTKKTRTFARDAEVLAYTAASWWTNVIIECGFDEGVAGPYSSIIFRDKLAELINRSLIEQAANEDVERIPNTGFMLACEYSPTITHELMVAANFAKISLDYFPLKTYMWIDSINTKINFTRRYITPNGKFFMSMPKDLPLISPPKNQPN